METMVKEGPVREQATSAQSVFIVRKGSTVQGLVKGGGSPYSYHLCIFHLLSFVVQLWGQVVNPQDIISAVGQDTGTIGGPKNTGK